MPRGQVFQELYADFSLPVPQLLALTPFTNDRTSLTGDTGGRIGGERASLWKGRVNGVPSEGRSEWSKQRVAASCLYTGW